MQLKLNASTHVGWCTKDRNYRRIYLGSDGADDVISFRLELFPVLVNEMSVVLEFIQSARGVVEQCADEVALPCGHVAQLFGDAVPGVWLAVPATLAAHDAAAAAAVEAQRRRVAVAMPPTRRRQRGADLSLVAPGLQVGDRHDTMAQPQ